MFGCGWCWVCLCLLGFGFSGLLGCGYWFVWLVGLVFSDLLMFDWWVSLFAGVGLFWLEIGCGGWLCFRLFDCYLHVLL